MAVYERTYTADEIRALKGRELKSYNSKEADFDQALGKLKAERGEKEKEGKRVDAATIKKSATSRRDKPDRNDTPDATRQQSSADNTARGRKSTGRDADATTRRNQNRGPGDSSDSRQQEEPQQPQKPSKTKKSNDDAKSAVAAENRGKLEKSKLKSTNAYHSGDGNNAAAVAESRKEKDKGASSEDASIEQPANSSVSPLRRWFGFGGKNAAK